MKRSKSLLARSLLAALCFQLSAGAVAATMPVGLVLQPGPTSYSVAVSQMVRSIAEYSRWPDESRPLSLCVVGPTQFGGSLGKFELSRGRTLSAMPLPNPASDLGQCDALYIGRLSLNEQRRLAAAVRGRAVLTIAENDPTCRSNAMFCLQFQPRSLNFRVNLDAISRSQIRVDARVLRLSSPQGALQ